MKVRTCSAWCLSRCTVFCGWIARTAVVCHLCLAFCVVAAQAVLCHPHWTPPYLNAARAREDLATWQTTMVLPWVVLAAARAVSLCAWRVFVELPVCLCERATRIRPPCRKKITTNTNNDTKSKPRTPDAPPQGTRKITSSTCKRQRQYPKTTWGNHA